MCFALDEMLPSWCARRYHMRSRGLALQRRLDAFFANVGFVCPTLCPSFCIRIAMYESTYALYFQWKTCPILCPCVWCFAWWDSSDARFLCPTLCPSSLYWNCHIKLRMDTKSASGHYNTINRGGKCPGPPAVRSSIVVLHLSRGGSWLLCLLALPLLPLVLLLLSSSTFSCLLYLIMIIPLLLLLLLLSSSYSSSF